MEQNNDFWIVSTKIGKMVSKLEVRFRSLLVNCEELSKDELNFPRIRKFIRSLERMMGEIQDSTDLISEDTKSDYNVRLTTLKEITNYSEAHESRLLDLKPKTNSKSNDDLNNRQIANSKLFVDLRKELINGKYQFK